jgi:hypothetical protein
MATTSKRALPSNRTIQRISVLSEQMLSCNRLAKFQMLLNDHEHLVSDYIGMTPVRERLFSDFDGSVKSLGAWGGDFVMAASNLDAKETLHYFSTKGVTPLFRFNQIVLNKSC